MAQVPSSSSLLIFDKMLGSTPPQFDALHYSPGRRATDARCSPADYALPLVSYLPAPGSGVSGKTRLMEDCYVRHLPEHMHANLLVSGPSKTRYVATSKFTQGCSGKALWALQLPRSGRPDPVRDLRVIKKFRLVSYEDKKLLRVGLDSHLPAMWPAASCVPPQPQTRKTLASSNLDIRHEQSMQQQIGCAGKTPRLLDAFGVGSDHYMVMDPMDISLQRAAQLLRSRPQTTTSALERGNYALHVGVELTSQLDHALHRRNLVHADISADNILMSAAGAVGFADFGRARRIDDYDHTPHYVDGYKNLFVLRKARQDGAAPALEDLCQSAYIAPEAFVNEAAPLPYVETLLRAQDVWSLGATLLDLLASDAGLMPLRSVSDKQHCADYAATCTRQELFWQACTVTLLGAQPLQDIAQPGDCARQRTIAYLRDALATDGELASLLLRKVLMVEPQSRLGSAELHRELVALQHRRGVVGELHARAALQALRAEALPREGMAQTLMAIVNELEHNEPELFEDKMGTLLAALDDRTHPSDGACLSGPLSAPALLERIGQPLHDEPWAPRPWLGSASDLHTALDFGSAYTPMM